MLPRQAVYRHFPDLPAGESCLGHWRCSLRGSTQQKGFRDSLGHLYLTDHHFCFRISRLNLSTIGQSKKMKRLLPLAKISAIEIEADRLICRPQDGEPFELVQFDYFL